jgi:PAS domain S-box-containing protein
MRTEPGQATADQLRALIDEIPAMYFAVDAHGTVLAVNRFGAEYLGYAVDDLLGRPVLEVVAESDRDRVRNDLVACVEMPGQVCRWNLRKVRKDGTVIQVRETARPVVQPDGEVVIVIVCDDVTETKRVQDELSESEERYRLLLDMVPQHIWTTDAAGYHNYFSRRWYDYTGAAPEATRGEGWLQFLHPEDRPATLERWRRSLETGEPYEVEYRFRNASGKYHWFLGQAMPQLDESGAIVRWIGTLTDIEERRRIASERERLLAVEREAREQVTTILESISDAFIAVDHEWRFTYLNGRGEELIRQASGRAAGEMIGQTLPEALPEVWDSEFGDVLRRAMAERKTVHHEAYLAAWDRWFEVHDYPSGTGLAIYFQDVTERKLVERERELVLEREQRARAEAERWAGEERALREAIAAVSASVTTEEVIRQIASSAVAATGANGALVAWVDAARDEVEAVAEAGEIPPHPRRFPYAESYTRRVIDLGSPFLVPRLADVDGPIWTRDLTGSYGEWSMLVLPLSSGGEPIGALFLAREPERQQFTPEEITRARTFGDLATLAFRKLLLLEESQRRRQELERTTESRGRLMRGFSHDLKNPLGAADGHAQLLEDGILGDLLPKQKESVGRIRRSIYASLRLIEDLLELARAEAGQIELNCAPADVAEVARDAVEDFRAQATTGRLGLALEGVDSVVGITDPMRVRQILSNLISNAVKYTPVGKVTVRVERRGDGEGFGRGEWIAVSVDDTGPGIPAEKQVQIFQEFTRLDPSAPHGAGVGLAISRRIAQILGGEITLRSEPGEGSSFTLWLPLI